MPYHVYILKSKVDGTYYKRSSENYLNRFEQHNAGLCRYTSTKIPWDLFYVEEEPDKRSMLIRERKTEKVQGGLTE